ncbi:MAG: NAD-dependent epimerase/dehydratase family protein [Candidatus Omnitrophica bacterium]|nr:NAD-dependent epimerase/dehydratase family protein [Candidatus Omnitrophota bacterium]
MRNKGLKNAIAKDTSSIKDVMRIIDRSGLRVAYIIDRDEKLIGAVSDSEIRRAIIDGKDVKSCVKDIINFNPVMIKEKDLDNKFTIKRVVNRLLNRMPDSKFILLTNNYGIPKKLLSCHLLLGRGRKINKKIVENGKKVLVVGGAGYLGSILIRKLLQDGFKVKVLDILMYGSGSIRDIINQDGFEFIEGDMRNISTLVRALSDVDSVVNLAAIVGDPACKNKPDAAIETNYLANKILAEACKYHQINKFIYASTCSVYGTMNGRNLLSEDAPLNPVSLYARSKIQSEEGILSLEDENFSPTILRMGTLYGYSPRMRFDLVVNAMTKTAAVDNKILVFGGAQSRPLLNVIDAADAFLKCLISPLDKIKGEVFNVGSENQNYKIIDIAKIVNICIPEANLIIEGKAVDKRDYLVSFSKIRKTLNFKAKQELEKSINIIKDAIKKGEISDTDNPKYYNVENV